MTDKATQQGLASTEGLGQPQERDTAVSEMSCLLDLSARQAVDAQVLEAAVKVMGGALNDLLAACHGPGGNLKTPDKKEVMRARSMLPPRYSYALSKKV